MTTRRQQLEPHDDPVDHGEGWIAQMAARLRGGVLFTEFGGDEAVEDDLAIATAVRKHLGADHWQAIFILITGERGALCAVFPVAARDCRART